MSVKKIAFGKRLRSLCAAGAVFWGALALLAVGTGQALAADSTGEAGPITVASLLDGMTNLADMPEFPSPAYACRQFSSYDRDSKSPTKPGWFANKDYGQYLRVEERDGRKEYVLMDAEGPGAIVRIWSANPFSKGKYLRIYIDGADRPSLEAPFSDLLGGTYPGMPSPIAGVRGKGYNLNFPIPYAKHCKVTVTKERPDPTSDRPDALFYLINYLTYPTGTKVVSFRNEQMAALDAELKALASSLDAPAGLNAPPAGATTKVFDASVAAGVSSVLGTFNGPSSVRLFRLQWTPSGDRDEPALRSILLRMTFDGKTTVVAPLGDFFGAGPGINPYESLPLSVAEDGRMDSRWVMPFRKTARIEVFNHGKAAVSLKGEIVTAPYEWTDATMLFHAKWRVENDVNTLPPSDWNYMTATGKGVFAGVAFMIDNPVKIWWGEGDEKIYVDGETFPSWFGTGTEDYFGYAWGSPEFFQHAYHNQPRGDGPDNYGRTVNNRFHIIDRIPFKRDFRFDMELLHWKGGLVAQNAKVTMFAMAYWYAFPGAADGFQDIQVGDLVVRPLPLLFKVPGAIEGMEMKVIKESGRSGWRYHPQASDESTRRWVGAKPSESMVLSFDAPQAGPQRIFVRFAKARDFGIAQFAINGEKAGPPVDFYSNNYFLTDEIELGTFNLKAGENRLTVTIVGANEKAVKNYTVMIDYLILKLAR